MDIVAIRAAMIDHALSLGLFASVSGHEPKAAPATGGLTGAVWADLIEPARARSGLDSTTVRLVWNVRVGTNMVAEPQDDIDLDVLVAVAALMQAYSGDFTLGGAVEEVDLLGAYGTPLAARAGYLNQDVFTQAP
jgi:hypothetical protein